MKKVISLILPFSLMFLFSCNFLDLKEENTAIIGSVDHYLISSENIEDIANNFINCSKKLKSSKNRKKKVETISPISNDNGDILFYIINYKDGGFLILSADKRSEPILAFSEESVFDLSADSYPSVLVGWLNYTKNKIEKIKKGNKDVDKLIKKQWEILNDTTLTLDFLIASDDRDGREEPSPDCTPYYIQKGPFLSTTWHQGCTFNDNTPYIESCYYFCNHAPAGCVAVAMGQVMRYYQYPSNYNWSSMPGAVGSSETSRLLADIGSAVNMSYSCDGSGANTSGSVPSAFTSNFGYCSAVYSDYDYQVVKSEIDNNRPVVLKGGSQATWFIFPYYTNGHAWVCDGYLRYVDPCNGTILQLYMSWGWANGNYNGWYNFNNFNPGSYTFNYQPGMVYNINP